MQQGWVRWLYEPSVDPALCSGSDAIGRLKIDAQTAPRALMRLVSNFVAAENPSTDQTYAWKEEIKTNILYTPQIPN